MNKRFIIFVCLFLIVVLSIIAYVVCKNKNKFSVPEMESINSIKIIPARTGACTREELFFDLSKKEYRDTVNNILNWLKSGHVVGKAEGEFFSMGGSPTDLVIELKNGTSIQIESAVGSIVTKIPNGTEVKAQSIYGQVTIYGSNIRDHIRDVSPELKSFIDNGWESIFNYTY